MALSACRAAVVPRHGTARHEKIPFVSCLGRHLGMMARHGTEMSSCLIGPGHFGLVPCSGRAARLEYYNRSYSYANSKHWALGAPQRSQILKDRSQMPWRPRRCRPRVRRRCPGIDDPECVTIYGISIRDLPMDPAHVPNERMVFVF
jgi:hypothetical protein